jgi:hypothetical protein
LPLLALPESDRNRPFLRGDREGIGCRWLRGEGSVRRFDLPQARSFATAFCKRCGSPMPHLTRSGREAIIHAGAFDDPLGAPPDRHVHWASRAGWYRHGEGLVVEE